MELIRKDQNENHFRISVRSPNALNSEFEKTNEFDSEISYGILSYSDEKLTQNVPILARNCTKDKKCLVFNCPFMEYPKNFYNFSCLHLQNQKSHEKIPDEIKNPNSFNVQRIFLNFHWNYNQNSVNGIRFKFPMNPPFFFPNENQEKFLTKCPEICGKNSTNLCDCTQIINLNLNSIVELVIYNFAEDTVRGDGYGHPFHLHGHHFFVVKQGWPVYDEEGQGQTRNFDLTCPGDFCNNAQFINQTWNQNGIPKEMGNFEAPVFKDTLFLPLGGYAVLRFKADKPGIISILKVTILSNLMIIYQYHQLLL